MYKYIEEFEFAKQIINEAYEKIIKNPITNIEIKRDNSLVTNIDIECEKYILSKIHSKYPNDNFVSEETNSQNEVKSRTWLLDPIDGTICFIKRFKNWSVQLAFVDEEKTQFSIMYFPDNNELFTCLRGNGVYLNGKKIDEIPEVDKSQCVVEYCGRAVYKKLDITSGMCNILKDNVPIQMFLASASGSFCNLIAQRTNFLISANNKPWDIIPGRLLCEEMGAKIITTKYGINFYSFCPEVEELMKNYIESLEG